MKNEKIRLQKFLSQNGVCSRRKAEEYILSGKVKINGRKAEIGQSVDPKRDKVTLHGKLVAVKDTKVYIMLNKPRGYVTTLSDEFGRKTVLTLVKGVGERVFPVGRLDKDSEGLLIMTNDGELSNLLTHPKSNVNKVYKVTVGGEVTDQMIETLSSGVVIDGRKTKPCDVYIMEKKTDRTVLGFIIHEGRNRQIRKMCDSVGLKVLRLKRVEIAGVKLGGLKLGDWRLLNERELTRLQNISKSEN
ncbi:MAG: rRNA pseudouridine synthase [Clostridia bacterium]|nr:rRNA pseudouridine synthase [Clostridia bacterium]